MLGRLLRRLLAVGPLFALAVACASPTIPLPPPEEPTLERTSDPDHIRLVGGCGSVESDAEVIVLNRNSALPGNLRVAGALANGCGAWFAVVYAHTGDALDITQTNGAVVSPAETVQVQ